MEAITLLKNDRVEIRALLANLETTTSRALKKRGELLAKIEACLKAHTTIEEEIFYPAFKAAGEKSKDDNKMYFEALEEHRAAGELVLPDLMSTDIGCEKFDGRAKVLKELVVHHADEEEQEMFPRARKLLRRDELKSLDEQLEVRKQELLA